MTNYYMAPYINTTTTPATLPDAQNGYGGKIITLQGQLTYAAQASGSVIVIGQAQAGWLFVGGAIYTDTTTGSATLAIGGTQAPLVSGTPLATVGTFQSNCYKAAAALTTVDAWAAFYSNVSATHPFLLGIPQRYSQTELFKITTAAASLPASGNLLCRLHFMVP